AAASLLPLVALPAGAQLDAVTRAGASCARLRRLTLPLRAAPRYLDDDELRRETAALQRLRHAHLVSVVGSYAVPGAFHVLLAPAPSALTLRDFTAAGARPNRFKKLLKAGGDGAAAALANWPACLASALAWLHHRHGLRHGALRPSNVLVGADHHVALGLFDAFDALLPTRRPLDLEAYQYAAPEHYPRPAGHDGDGEEGEEAEEEEEEVLQPKLLPALTLPRRAAYSRPRPSPARPASASSFASSARNPAIAAPTASVASLSKPAGAVPTNRRYDLAADVFALAALTLDILTGLCRKKHAVFERHRSAYNRRAPGYGGKLPDASFHCHRNAGQIASWIVILERDAARHKGPVYRAVAPTLAAVRPMLARRPAARPSAAAVAHRFAQALRCVASDYEPHCPVEPDLEPESVPPPPPPRHPSSSTLSSGAASAFPLTPDAPAPAPALADPVLDRYCARVPSSCYSFDDDPAGHPPPDHHKQPPPLLLHHPPKKPHSKPAPVIAPSGLDLIDPEDIGRGIDLDAGVAHTTLAPPLPASPPPYPPPSTHLPWPPTPTTFPPHRYSPPATTTTTDKHLFPAPLSFPPPRPAPPPAGAPPPIPAPPLSPPFAPRRRYRPATPTRTTTTPNHHHHHSSSSTLHSFPRPPMSSSSSVGRDEPVPGYYYSFANPLHDVKMSSIGGGGGGGADVHGLEQHHHSNAMVVEHGNAFRNFSRYQASDLGRI
ncbi:hypothetical protein LOZ66_004255, partial [Ophidiomyces ophidiicola]